jgi:two-component system, NarL family, nitrate/nitrite response regulator NarL
MYRILIAVPDDATRKALALLLRRKLDSDSILEIEDVEALIRAVADVPPDLLLLDWKLYGSPAPETCRLLRKAYPLLKIIVLSVDASDETAAREAGADFVHKGASPDELISILHPLISKKTMSDKSTEVQNSAGEKHLQN